MKALIGVLTLVAVLALAVAGCGRSGDDESVAKLGTTGSSEGAASEAETGGEGEEGGGEEPMLAYSECMRENGIADFPEPVEGQLKIEAGPGSDLNPESPAFQKAEEACRSLAPSRKKNCRRARSPTANACAKTGCPTSPTRKFRAAG
jgi:hypothetical protein